MRTFTVIAFLAAGVTGSLRGIADEPHAVPPQAAVVIAPAPTVAGMTPAVAGRASVSPGAAKPLAHVPSSAVPVKARKSGTAKGAAHGNRAPKKDEPHGGMKWHTVKKGQRLGSIAKRYHVTLEALLHANDIPRRNKLKAGMKLLVPGPDDGDGELARLTRVKALGLPTGTKTDPSEGDKSRESMKQAGSEKGQLPGSDARASRLPPTQNGSWLAFVERPKKKGLVTLKGMKGEFHGRLLAPSGRFAPKARREAEHVLSADGENTMDPELLKLIVRVSDTFGGRTIDVVSGFRTVGTAEQSRHKHGKALDFTLDGVPLEALRDYCKSLDGVGVGFYPNSGFIHLDVRDRWAFWVDESARGEPPRYVEATAKPVVSAVAPAESKPVVSAAAPAESAPVVSASP